MFDRLGTFVSRRWLLVLLCWAALVAVGGWIAPRWEDVTHDGDFAYLPPEMTSVRGQTLLEEAFPNSAFKSQIVLVVSRRGKKLAGADYEVASRLLEKLRPGIGPGKPITNVWSYDDSIVGDKLISPPRAKGQALLIVLQLRTEFMAIDNMRLLAEIYDMLNHTRYEISKDTSVPAGLELGVTGSAAVGYDMLRSAEQSIKNTELTTILLVVLILFLVYRAPGLVIVPLATIVVSVVVSLHLVATMTQLGEYVGWIDFKVFKTTRIFIVVILFGAGTDYCLFLISRYREELRRGLQPAGAIAVALGRVGDALAASALTTIVGLGMMFFADFGKFSNSGPAIATCLVVALAACLTLAPAMLAAAGKIVFWPFGGKLIMHVESEEVGAGEQDLPGLRFTGFWQRVSRMVIARPGLILVISVLLLAPLMVEGFSVPVTYDLLHELDSQQPSVRGTAMLQDYFSPGETGPIVVLTRLDKGTFDTPQGRGNISLLTKDLFELEYTRPHGKRTRPIQSVRSLTNPLGDPPGGYWRKAIELKHPKTKVYFLSQAPPYAGKVTRFLLILRSDPFSRESVEMLNYVQAYLDEVAADPASPWHGATFEFAGTTAGIRDLQAVTQSDQLRIQVLVVLAVFAVLLVILRRPGICLYLILSVLVGYFVTIGITELFFSWLHADTFHGLDWKVPLFLFVILIAIGEDYNIYLATRVFEEQRRRGPIEGLRVAIVRTGGIITSCGIIMAGTFASMATGTLRAMHELGFALSLGVLLDTFIIRTILVPAFLALLARRLEKGERGDD